MKNITRMIQQTVKVNDTILHTLEEVKKQGQLLVQLNEPIGYTYSVEYNQGVFIIDKDTYTMLEIYKLLIGQYNNSIKFILTYKKDAHSSITYRLKNDTIKSIKL